ncbi:MAG TPA: hypothetical protein VJM77_01240 [Nitrospiria bacterium]|nr:hypothetical protein [Nitrospiria bacterium]
MGRKIWLLMAVFALWGMQGCGGSVSARGPVTIDQLTGIWEIMGSGTQNVGANQGFGTCAISFAGTITINADGSVSMTRTNHTCTGDTPVNDTGTLSVDLFGRGTLSFTSSGEAYEIQFSRSLEVATFANITGGGVFVSGTAVRQ